MEIGIMEKKMENLKLSKELEVKIFKFIHVHFKMIK